MSLISNTAYKKWQNRGFLWCGFSRVMTEILPLHGKLRFRGNPYSGIFYAVQILNFCTTMSKNFENWEWPSQKDRIWKAFTWNWYNDTSQSWILLNYKYKEVASSLMCFDFCFGLDFLDFCSRSNSSHMFSKIDILKNSAIFTGKHLCWSILLMKLQAWWLYSQVFSSEYCGIFKNTFFMERLWWLLPLLEISGPNHI